jgi:hypothetical protein
MNKVTKYINENDIEDMFQAIVKSGKDIRKIIQDIRSARTEFQIKTQQLQWKLEEYLEGKNNE